MSADPLTTSPRAASEQSGLSTRDTWHEIESLVDDLASLAKTEVSAREFYTALLDRAVRALAATGGAIWLRGGDGWRLECHSNLSPTLWGSPGSARDAHLQWVESACQVREVKTLLPGAGSAHDGSVANPTEFLLLACPLRIDDEPFGLIEILQRPGASPAAQRGYVQLLGVLCEVASDFQRNHQLRELRRLESLWGRFDRFAEAAHRSLDLDTAAYTIANEGRRLIECSRVSVAARRGRGPRMAAISGIDDFDRRSNVVRLLEQLAYTAYVTREPIWYRGETTHLPPQVTTALNAYVEETHVRFLAVLPLIPVEEGDAEPVPVGVLIVEDFEAPADEEALRQRVAIVARHASAALRNAITLRNIPLSAALQALGKLSWFVRLRQLPYTVLALAALVAAVAALALVPADFKIEGRGELQPEIRRDLFAPSDGIVSELAVEHGSPVSKHQPQDPQSGLLLKLRNLELEFEFSRLTGERQTAETELATVLSARLTAKEDTPEAREQFNQLVAKEEELKELLKSLNNQLEVLGQQQAILTLYSSITGKVLTWNVEQTLKDRPVKRGQLLLTLAQTEGPWIVEMHVPDQHVGYVLAAQDLLRKKEHRDNLDVSFILKTDPGVTYQGQIISVAKAADADAAHAGTVLVTVAFDREQIPELRPGATVVAQIHCGRRPIGYVWFHDLIETVRTKLLF